MRTIFFLLLLANLTMYAYARLDSGSIGEGARLAQQVQPGKIKLLTPQQVAALGPAKVAALADVCVEWGPFADAERTRVLAELEPSGLGRLLTQRRVDTNTAYWVFLPRSTNRTAIDKRVADLKAAGIKDIAVVEAGPLRYTISLGVFRTEEAANAYAAELARQDVTDARVGPRQQVVPQTLLVIRDPDSAVVGRIRALLPGYPGTEIRTGPCEKVN
jgi:hypothetical protein